MNTTLHKSLFVRAIMVLLVMLVSATAGAEETPEVTSWVLWSKDSKTLYFVRDNENHGPGTYDCNDGDVYITNAWKIVDKNDSKILKKQKIPWVGTAKSSCTKVVFEDSFSDARPIYCNKWFKDFGKLETIEGIENLNTDEVTTMNQMFYGCHALTQLDVSGFNTTNVTDMSSMFKGCSALTELDVSAFDAASVKDISHMFYGCSALETLLMSEFKAEKLKSMGSLFKNCSALETIDMSGFDTGGVKSLANLFKGNSTLTTIDLSGLNAPKVTNMSGMFANCSALETVKLSELTAPTVTNMSSMFSNCSALTSLDLHCFSNTKKNNTDKMFNGCTKLVSIFVDDTRWRRVKKGGKKMFYGCNSLVGEDGTRITNYNTKSLQRNGIAYAHTEKGGLLKKYIPGYLLTGDFVTFYIGENAVSKAEKDDIITMKVNVPEGNTLKELTAMCGETEVALTYDDVKGVYTFTMPEGAVTVATTFSQNYTLTGMEGITFRIGEEVVTQALAGTTVSYTVSIPAGKEIDEVTVMQGENTVPCIQYDDGAGQFTMPAGNVTVTATYQDLPMIPEEFTLTGEDNMLFFVDGTEVEADELGIIKVMTGSDVVVKVEAPEGQALDVLTVKQGETSLEVKTDEEDELYFTMPAGDVTVTATYMNPFNLLSGELVDAESGERVNDYVDFYNDKLNLINEAFKGEKVLLDVDPDVIPANMYFTGVFTSDDVTIVEEDETTHYIIMPEKDVTVNAVMASQETLVLNLLTNDATETIDNGELANLMMQWEGYLVGSETVQDNPSESYPYTCHWYFDLDGNGVRDVVLTERCINESTESTYTIQRLEGTASLGENYCLTLRSPGLPLKYKDALFNFGKSETITCVFFFEELSNKHTLANYDGKTVNVSFPERILYKDGDWNTICLPFDVTVAGSPLDGDGVTVKTLKGASLENGTLALTFTEGSETELKAGVPYLIKWTKPDGYVPFNYNPEEPCYDLYAPTFKNVTLDIILKPVVVTDLIAFDGTYTSWEYKQDSPSVLLMGAENNLYYPQYYSYLNCFRAYFQLLGGIKAIDPGLGGSIKSMVIDFGEEETDIEELKDGETGDVKNEGWYTLSGVKLAGKPSVSGIYLFNGKKVAVQ